MLAAITAPVLVCVPGSFVREDGAQQQADHRGHREGQHQLFGTPVEHLQLGDNSRQPDPHR